MNTESPFHAGERAVQSRMGVRDQIETFARQVVRSYLPDEHQQFYAGLPYMVIAARDHLERPWVSLLVGEPGFVSSPSADELRLDAQFSAGDALSGQVLEGNDVGLLGIELATRRRNRVNGRVLVSGDALHLKVAQSFGNCPAFIHPREWRSRRLELAVAAERSAQLNAEQATWIRTADTLFIGSGHRGDSSAASTGMDASHRGGEAGFVGVIGSNSLVIPDYSGNNHFNTVGNLVEDPRVGLLFVDFESGRMLQLTGEAVIDWDSPAVAHYPGARRLIEVTIEEVVEIRNALPIRWEPATRGTRVFRVAEKTVESPDITSFELVARDSDPLASFLPGQHLPIELMIDGIRHSRTYSLSAGPENEHYRLTVKRASQGLVSGYLHDRLGVGDSLRASPPAGEFHLQAGIRPVVLISAGVGVTPMMSMLQALADPSEQREVLFVHGVRSGKHQPLKQELKALIASSPRLSSCIAYSQPDPEDQMHLDYQYHGRVDIDLVDSLVSQAPDADYYLCGPVAFMAQLRAGLMAIGIPEVQIHAELFGPAD